MLSLSRRIAVLLLIGVIMPALALDCPSLQILPHLPNGKVLLEGWVMQGRMRTGLRRRDRLRSLFSSGAASESVVLAIGPRELQVALDPDGRFSVEVDPWTGSPSIELRARADATVLASKAHSLGAAPSFLIISDIDDTILVSEVTNRFRLFVNALLKKVGERQPVPGTPNIYRALASGSKDLGLPQFVYLTCSPAAMGRFLENFLAEHGFPTGPLSLKRSLKADGTDPVAHKTKWLKRLRDFFPRRPLLLLGDSGEKDPEIYADFAESQTGRILAVVIRKVAVNPKTETRLAAIAGRLASLSVPLVTWATPEEMAAGLASAGLLFPVDRSAGDSGSPSVPPTSGKTTETHPRP